MNTRYETDDDLQDLRDSRGEDREISLGTPTILGIFFALALLCAVFFGFGYSLGRKAAQPVANVTESAAPSSESNSPKPAPGSLANRAASVSPATHAEDTSQSSEALGESSNASEDETRQTPAPTRVKAVAADFHPDVRVEPAVKAPAKPVAAPPVAVAGPGVAVVQVAAVSHQEDADVLITALKRKGYSVAIRHEPQDKLLHVQIGPFASKKDADAMRLRLQTDGYNAIVK